jgi:hypothetical protein
MTAGVPSLLRSYPTSNERNAGNRRIWEAAQAIGGMGYNNPTDEVLQEAERVFPSRHVACVISVGTGLRKVISIKKSRWWESFYLNTTIKAVKNIESDCERIHQAVATRFQSRPNTYFRFSVENGMQSIKMDKWDNLGAVVAHTDHYLQLEHVQERLRAAVSIICDSNI